MEELAGKTAVVTGAGSGMGKAFALRFAAEGMNVAIGDIQDDALRATVSELEAGGTPALGLHVDVSSPSDIEALADAAEKRFGPIHLACNNAGVEGYLDGPIWEATAKDWEWTVGVNFWSVVHGVRTFVPRMLAHGQPAHVVNTCSMTSVVQATNMYGITKHAVIALSEVLWHDLREAGAPIGVTALCPGTIATNLFHGSRNRPIELTDDGGNISDTGKELREHMHGVLAAGMPPSEVAGKLVAAIRGDGLYLLTDHEWDPQIIERHEAIMAGAVGPAVVPEDTAGGAK
ncbi:MAG: SDR family NAD(P)-dependent oxidoreductase [Nocardiopsaceae bacterium]|nr:SDR family NAD(P)-dependent oxidoreductase [Nocardiopsaceae bacterium]